MSKYIFDRLPVRNEVIASVTQGVDKSCTESKCRVRTLAANVLELPMVQSFVWNWWGFRKDTLMENSDQPPTSARAARYTHTQREIVKKRY